MGGGTSLIMPVPITWAALNNETGNAWAALGAMLGTTVAIAPAGACVPVRLVGRLTLFGLEVVTWTTVTLTRASLLYDGEGRG
jgi:hypothetical protein